MAGAVATAALLVSCAEVASVVEATVDAATDPGPTADAPVTVPRAHAQAVRLLDGLRTGGRERPGTYERDAFGAAWADTDGNGCNQRDDVLRRDALPGTVVVAVQGGCDHDVLAGSWVDPYSGTVLTFDDLKDLGQAQAIQIDHVVPLSEAWTSGADGWAEDRRRAFAGDTRNLLAVDGPTNAGKGDDDPAAWRPRAPFQCAYAVRWVRVKSRYDLAADASEVRALGEMLDRC